jgi:hypothetical protein
MGFLVVYTRSLAAAGVIPKSLMALNIWRNTQLKNSLLHGLNSFK